MFQLLPYIIDMHNVQALSPSHGLRRASPLPEGAFAQIPFFDTLRHDKKLSCLVFYFGSRPSPKTRIISRVRLMPSS